MILHQTSALHAALSRRHFLGLALSAGASHSFGRCEISRFGTPYKYQKLVLSASGEKGRYDSESVDCPFVFRQGAHFYMTFIAFDGVGYQTGLAVSDDLVRWRKQGAMLRRDPSSPVLKYNVAMNWILRENELRSPGNLKKVDGDFIGVYHAYPSQGYERGAAVIGLCRSRDLHDWQPEPHRGVTDIRSK